MILIIAEKAIAGRRIAAILAGKNLPDSRTANALHFDFEKGKEQYTVIPLSGHIVDVDFAASMQQWLGTDLRKLVDAPIYYVETEQYISGLLKKIAPRIDEVIIATDADREGEAIGLEALNLVKEANPNVVVKRANFSAITDKDINDAFAKLDLLDFNLAESANSRREIDLMWGAVLTRLLSLVSGRLGKEFLSVGRVQGPTLALIVDREKQRLAFAAQKYWEIEALFEKDSKSFLASHKEGRFLEKEKALAVMKCKEPPIGIVVSAKKKQKNLSRPLPFNTTSFLGAATAIGFTAGRAMQVAESLYQAGLISYPRTDNAAYPPTLDLKETLRELGKVPEFRPFTERLLQQEKLVPSAGKPAKDHPPIHPVTAAEKNRLDPMHWRIYELVCRRFMATLAPDAITENILVEIDLNKQPFIATGQTYIKKGWKDYYTYSKAVEVILPPLAEGDKLKLLKLENLEKETLPPPRYSQGALIKAMSELNLGTKSTRAETIQKLYSRKYIEGQKAIAPTKIAFAVIDSFEKHESAVVKPEMTANLEKEMDLVAAGEKDKESVVSESRAFLSTVLEQLLLHKNEIGSLIRNAARADSIIGPCPGEGCTGELLIRKGRTGKRFLGCSAYPKCTTTFPLPQKGNIVVLPERCPECGHIMLHILGKRYRFKMCISTECKTKDEWKSKRLAKQKADEEEKAKVAEETGQTQGPEKKPLHGIAHEKKPAREKKKPAAEKKPKAKAAGKTPKKKPAKAKKA